jgi:hypothetical protein
MFKEYLLLECLADIYSKWNDANCGLKKEGFVCKKPIGGGWTTPKPTIAPEG